MPDESHEQPGPGGDDYQEGDYDFSNDPYIPEDDVPEAEEKFPGQEELYEATPEEYRQNRVAAARESIAQAHPDRRRVNPEDELHQRWHALQAKDQISQNGPRAEIILGANSLHQLDNLRSTGEASDEDLSRVFKSARFNLLYAGVKRTIEGKNMPDELIEGLGFPDHKLTETGEMPDNATQQIRTAIDGLSDEAIEQFLRAHFELVSRQLEARQPELENLKEDFLKKVASAREQGKFPLDESEARRRLDAYKLTFADPLLMGEYNAEVDSQMHEIRFNPESPKSLEKTATHEFLHGLAGRTEVIDENYRDVETSDVPEDHKVSENIRFGLQIPRSKSRVGRFSWLDEVMTEKMAMELDNTSEISSYTNLMPLADHLESRVDRQYFIRAQYENFDPEVGTPAWGELIRQINTKFEPGLLLKLDRLIFQDHLHEEKGGEHDVPEAIAYMDEHYPVAA